MLDKLHIDGTELLDDQADTAQLTAIYRLAIRALGQDFREHFSQRVLAVSNLIQLACDSDNDAMIGYAHLDDNGAYTVLHPLHQSIFVETLMRRLALPSSERQSIVAASLTANIAMLNLQEVLLTQTAPLIPSQQKLVQLHPVLSNEMLLELGVNDSIWSAAVLSHHERIDGKGYPAGKEGEEIPRGARVIALADVYDAMIKPRKHREANQREALKYLFQQRGLSIDANLTALTIKGISVYPPDAFVKLHNGKSASSSSGWKVVSIPSCAALSVGVVHRSTGPIVVIPPNRCLPFRMWCRATAVLP